MAQPTGSSPFKPNIYITGHNTTGQAIVQDTYPCREKVYANHAFTTHDLYSTSRVPVDLNADADITTHEKWAAAEKAGLTVKNGTVCRFVNLAPGHQPMSHRTQSLDLGIVMEGEVTMLLDDGTETRLRKGDVVVQRATMHARTNPSQTEWAKMVFFLQDCEPVEGVKEDLETSRLGDIFTATH